MNRSTTRSRLSAASMIAVLALTGTTLAACGNDSDDSTSANQRSSTELSSQDHNHAAEADLQAAMRTLWAQHMEWTWATVLAFVEESPTMQAQLDRLLQNQKDIGEAIEPYYGKDAAKGLTDLLTVHINDAVPVLTAAKGGDEAGLKKALDEWYANAQDIADFLNAANPENWSKADVRDMMKVHIDTTVGYASALIGGDYAGAVKTYDGAESHMIHLADILAQGIIAQFPDKF